MRFLELYAKVSAIRARTAYEASTIPRSDELVGTALLAHTRGHMHPPVETPAAGLAPSSLGVRIQPDAGALASPNGSTCAEDRPKELPSQQRCFQLDFMRALCVLFVVTHHASIRLDKIYYSPFYVGYCFSNDLCERRSLPRATMAESHACTHA